MATKRKVGYSPPGMRAIQAIRRKVRANPTRTPAQRAATARMLAANKARRGLTPQQRIAATRRLSAYRENPTRTRTQRAARKKRNTKAGYYPNPRRKLHSVADHKAMAKRAQRAADAEHVVQRKAKEGDKWINVADFIKFSDAEEYARALHKKHPSSYIRVL